MRRVFVALLVVSVAGVACSKKTSTAGESPASSASGAPVSLSGSVTDKGTKDLAGAMSVELEADDFYFEPTFVKAAPGASITVSLKNNGKATHTFTIDSLHIDKTLSPGQSVTVTVALPQSGVVNWYCRFHRTSGMQGAFYFTPGGSAPASSPSGSSKGYGY